MAKTRILTAFAGVLVLVIGCGGEDRIDPVLERLGRAQAPPSAGGGMPHGMMPGAMGSTGPLHQGEVVETIQVPKYTYLKLKVADGSLRWAAIPSTEIETGKAVGVRESILMRNFHSRTLNRTFEKIVFGTLEEGAGAGDAGPKELPPGHPPLPAPGAAVKPAADAAAN